MTPQRRLGAALASISFLSIAVATMIATSTSSEPMPHLCIFCGSFGGMDFLLNVVLFLPFGLGLGLLRISWLRAAALILGFTLAIEGLQYVIPGRDSSVGDIIANTLGGLLGVLLARSWRVWLTPTPVVARALSWVAMIGWIGVLLLSIKGLEISIPRTTYWGQWQADLGQFDHFDGKLLSARINNLPVESGRMTQSDVFREQLEGKHVVFLLNVIPGPTTERLAPILSVFDEHQVEVLVIGQDQRDLVFRVRRGAADALLRTPSVKIDDIFPDRPASSGLATDTLVIRIDLESPRLAIQVESSTRGLLVHEILRLSPQLGWSLIVPFGYPLAHARMPTTALWIAALIFPIAYWCARGSVRRASSFDRTAVLNVTLLIAVIACGLWLLPTVYGLAPAQWWEWLAAATGAGSGWLTGRGTRARSTFEAQGAPARPDASLRLTSPDRP